MKKYRNNFNKRLQIFAGLILAVIAAVAMYYAPEFGMTAGCVIATIPIWGSIKDGTFKELTADQIKDMEPEELAKYYNDLNEHKTKLLQDAIEKSKTDASNELKDAIKQLKDDLTKGQLEQLKTLQDALKEQGLAIKQMRIAGMPAKRQSLPEYLEENKDAIVGLAKNEGNWEIVTVKANTVRASVTDSAEQYMVPEIGQLATRKLTFYDLFRKVPVGQGSGGVVSYYDWDEATTVRAAKVIAEGGAYSESTAKWKWYSLPLVKVGDIIPLSLEFEQDMPKFAAELEIFLQTNSIATEFVQR